MLSEAKTLKTNVISALFITTYGYGSNYPYGDAVARWPEHNMQKGIIH